MVERPAPGEDQRATRDQEQQQGQRQALRKHAQHAAAGEVAEREPPGVKGAGQRVGDAGRLEPRPDLAGLEAQSPLMPVATRATLTHTSTPPQPARTSPTTSNK